MTIKHLTLLLFFFGIISNVYAQSLTKNEKDEFTNKEVKETSWVLINFSTPSRPIHLHCRFRKVNSKYYIDLKIIQSSGTFAISEDAEIMFKFDDKEVLALHNPEYKISNNMEGLPMENQFINVSLLMTNEDTKKFIKNFVTKIRIYTTDGYIETDIKEKKAIKIPKAASLIAK